MKYNRTLALALLFAMLLSLPVLAAAGDSSDPLISQSHVDGPFRFDLEAAFDALCGIAVRSAVFPPADNGWAVFTLGAGDSIILRDGQQLVLLYGATRLEVRQGNLINCTHGRGSIGGDAQIGNRYVAWGGAEILVGGKEDALIAVSPGVEGAPRPTRPPLPEPTGTPEPTETPEPTVPPQPTEPPQPEDCPFEDVPRGAWYFSDVCSAYRRGLVNGVTLTTFVPQGNLTLAQAVKLAACMHQLDADGFVTLENAPDGQPWYYTYAGYALENGILTEMPISGWNDPVTRAVFVQLFFRALPEESYTAINEIPEGAIPDVEGFDPIGHEVYTFYAAGILTGYAEGGGRRAHEFGAATSITRAEVATIMNRMFDPGARVRFTIQ